MPDIHVLDSIKKELHQRPKHLSFFLIDRMVDQNLTPILALNPMLVKLVVKEHYQ